jgi:hypothetical protein
VPGHFAIDPCSHHSIHPTSRHGFPYRGVYSHFEPSRFDSPLFHCRGSRSTRLNGEVQRIVKNSSGHMVK